MNFLWRLIQHSVSAANLPPVEQKPPNSLHRCLEALAVLSRDSTFCKALLEVC